MRSGSQADPILLDLEDDNEVEFIGDEFAFLNLDETELSQDEVITIDDEEDDNNEPSVDSRRRSANHSHHPAKEEQNGPIEPACVIIDTYRPDRSTKIRAGDTVELEDGEEHLMNELHSGDFLRVKQVILNLETDEVKLRGHRLRRTKYHGQIFDWKLNEVVMVLQVAEDDTRCAFVQGLEDVPVKQVTGKRDCVITAEPYPMLSFRYEPTPALFANLSHDERRQFMYHQGRLVCRWLHIVTVNNNGKDYGGVVRGIYPHEADATPSRPTSAGSSVYSDVGGDFVMIDHPITARSGKRCRRSSSLEEIDQPFKTGPALPTKHARYTYGDAFCGAGGAATGAAQAGLHVMWGLDSDHHAMQAFAYNYPRAQFFLMNAHDFPPDGVTLWRLKVDILHLSPPCCYWSPAHTNPGQKDQENYEAIYTVCPILEKLNPRIATLEQTFGLFTNTQHKKNFRLLLNDMTIAGYDVRYKIQDLSEFGLPQRRKRLLLIAARRGFPLPPFPKPTHGPRGLKRFVSIADALRPLERQRTLDDDEYHQPHLMKVVNKAPSDPHRTMLKGCVTTGGGENYHYSGTRRYTPREMSLLQSFPYGYHFSGKMTQATKQIGNAFPSVMAEALFRSAAKTLEAFDNGLISVEDDLSDLDALLARKGIVIPQMPLNRLSLLDGPAGSSSVTSPYRYLTSSDSASETESPTKISSPFSRGSDIEPVAQQKKKKTSCIGFKESDDEGPMHPEPRYKKSKLKLSFDEQLWLAQEAGEFVEIVD